MRAYVFTDRSLGRQAGRFVWLSIDTEKAANAAFKKRYPVGALPTYLVLDPADGKVAMRWVGGATLPQLTKLFDDGARAVKKPRTSVDELLAKADRFYGESRWKEAAQAYAEVLAKAPRKFAPRVRVTESLLWALTSSDQHEACARTAAEAYPALKSTSSSANLAASGLSCALELAAENPSRERLVGTLEAACREVLANPRIDLAGDDRSGIYGTLVEARKDAKDEAGARSVAAEWAAYLEGEAAKALTPDARAVFDPHRLTAYLEMGEPARALPMLEASERDLPSDYNPPARLATALKALSRWDEAMAASDRAMARAYGPRKLLLYRTRADIYAGKGDAASARRTIEEAIRFAEALPEGQRSEGTVELLRKRLEGMK